MPGHSRQAVGRSKPGQQGFAFQHAEPAEKKQQKYRSQLAISSAS